MVSILVVEDSTRLNIKNPPEFKLLSENFNLMAEEFNLGEQIRQSILLLDNKFKSKNISLDISIEDFYINGNKEMLKKLPLL